MRNITNNYPWSWTIKKVNLSFLVVISLLPKHVPLLLGMIRDGCRAVLARSSSFTQRVASARLQN
jgi:hypothetical protein